MPDLTARQAAARALRMELDRPGVARLQRELLAHIVNLPVPVDAVPIELFQNEHTVRTGVGGWPKGKPWTQARRDAHPSNYRRRANG